LHLFFTLATAYGEKRIWPKDADEDQQV